MISTGLQELGKSFVISTGLQGLGTSFVISDWTSRTRNEFCDFYWTSRTRNEFCDFDWTSRIGTSFVISTKKDKHNKIQNNNEHPNALSTITVRCEEMQFHRQHESFVSILYPEEGSSSSIINNCICTTHHIPGDINHDTGL